MPKNNWRFHPFKKPEIASTFSLPLVMLDFVLKHDKLDPRFSEKLSGILPGVVESAADDPANTNTDNQHCTDSTGLHLAVKFTPFKGNSIAGRLTNSILLRVNRPHAVLLCLTSFIRHFLEKVAHIIAMFNTWRRANISGSKYSPISNNHTTALPPVAGGPRRSMIRHD
jgi:hypothetical protein